MLTKREYMIILSDIGRCGKLLLQIRRPYGGSWALAEGEGDAGGVTDSMGVDGDAVSDASIEGMLDEGMAEAGIETNDGVVVGDDVVVDGETEIGGSPDLSFIDEELAELEGKPALDDDKDLETPEGLEVGSSAEQRFQALANTVREQRTAATEHANQMQQATNYVQQLQQVQQQREQMLNQRLMQMQQQIQQVQQPAQSAQLQQPQYDQNDPVARLEHRIMETARAEFSAQSDEKYNALEQRFESYRTQQEAAAKEARIQAGSAQYKTECLDAATNIALKDMPKEVINLLQETIGTQIMTTALYQHTSVVEAAKMQRANTLRMVKAIMQQGSKGLKESLTRSKTAPPVTNGQPGAGGKGVSVPSNSQLAEMGYVGLTAVSDWAIDKGVVLPG